MKNTIAIGIDVGGSHITAGLVNLETRLILTESIIRERLNSQGKLDDILAVWTNVIKRAASYSSLKKLHLGMAMPGPFDYEEGISLIVGQSKYDALYGLNVKDLLSAKLGIERCNILMMNDASGFLKGEIYGGAANSYSSVIGLTLGTGLGSAKSNASLTYDAELWSLPFFESIVEDYLSTRWFLKRYEELSGGRVNNVKELAIISDTDLKALQVFHEFGKNLGLFLVKFIEMENPESVIIGGNISNAFPLFIDRTLSVLESQQITIPVIKSVLGEHASIIGAASLWADSKEFA